MVYEAEGAEMCVMKVGEPCKYAVDVDPEGKQLFHVHNCVLNSECDPEGYCHCSNGHFENSNSTCTLERRLGQYCDEDLKCSLTGGFLCEEKLCVCNIKLGIVYSAGNYCTGLAGKPCIEGNCVGNADCIDDICTCGSGYYQDGRGLCFTKGNIGDECSLDEECGKDELSTIELVCVDGKCNCDPKDYVFAEVKRTYTERTLMLNQNYWGESYYEYTTVSTERELCAPKANLDCVQGYCAPFTKCSFTQSYPAENDFQGKCTCEKGFDVSKSSGLCARQYGMSCDAETPCMDPLICTNSECRCKFNIQEFDHDNKLCLSKVNGPCKGNQDCKNKAICVIIPGSDSGHCACSYGYVPEDNDECKVAYGEKCETATECDSVAQLLCIEGYCKCGTFSEYSTKHRKCVGLVGSTCNPDDIIDCVGSAVCRSPHPNLKNRCTCPLGFVEAGNYTCTPHQDDPPLFVKDEVVETTPMGNANNSTAHPVESAISQDPVAPEVESHENEAY